MGMPHASVESSRSDLMIGLQRRPDGQEEAVGSRRETT